MAEPVFLNWIVSCLPEQGVWKDWKHSWACVDLYNNKQFKFGMLSSDFDSVYAEEALACFLY